MADSSPPDGGVQDEEKSTAAEEHARRLRLSVEQVLQMSEQELERAYKTTKVVGDTEDEQRETLRRDVHARWVSTYGPMPKVAKVAPVRARRGRHEAGRPRVARRSSASSATSSADPGGESDPEPAPASEFRWPSTGAFEALLRSNRGLA